MNSTLPAAALEPHAGCIAAAMDVIGSKWTALILRDLAGGPRRFCALEQSVWQINPRTLSQRLDTLEAQGVVAKTVSAGIAPRTEYSLTTKGRDLLPILRQMAAWGEKHHPAGLRRQEPALRNPSATELMQ